MSRIPPPIGSFAGFGPLEVPRAKLRVRAIVDALRRHEIAAELHEGIIATMQLAADDYLLSKARIEQGALKSKILDHVKQISKIEQLLRAALFGPDKEAVAAARVIKQNVMLLGGESGEDAHRALSQYLLQATAYAATLGPVKREAPAVAMHRRHVKLARAVATWFHDVDLPAGKTGSSLMAQLLGAVLDSVGEPHSRPDQLIDEVTWPELLRHGRNRRRGRQAKQAPPIAE